MTVAEVESRRSHYDDTPLEVAPQRRAAIFALSPGESLAQGLKRMLIAELGDARSALDDPAIGRDEAVHRVRRRLKRVRSLLAVLDAVPGAGRDGRVTRVVEIGRALAAAREADVAVAESRRLIARDDGRLGPAMARLVARFDAERQAAHALLPATETIVARLRACEADARSLPERFPAGRLLAEALGRSYRRGRRDWRALEDGFSVETMHDWRKRVKRRRHLSALVPIATAATTGSIQHDLERLGEMLGEEHDLALLQHRLEAERGRPEGREAHDEVADLLARRRRKLAKRALDLGEELYGLRGRRFDAELAGLAELC